MHENALDPYSTRNARFVVRLKPSLQKGDFLQTNRNDRICAQLFKDEVDYSIIPNLKSSSVYLSSTTYSGRLLNSHPKVRDETNNRFLFTTASEKYDFDGVYYDNCRQEDFYNENVSPLLLHLLKKTSSIVIAYGPQSAGKSFTMRENRSNRLGVVPRFAENLIQAIRPTKFKLFLTVVQIYKDWVFDLLRIDTDISHYLESNYDTGGISTVKIDGCDHFKNVFENALEKAKANCSITSRNQTKFHLVTRFALFEENKSGKFLHSKIDFVDLVESSFSSNQNNYESSEIKWLSNSFSNLHSFLEKVYGTEAPKKKQKVDILTGFLENNSSLSDSKLLFISCLSTSVDEIKDNRIALEFATALRSSFLRKSSSRRLSMTPFRESAFSTIPNSTDGDADEDSRPRPSFLETSFKAKLNLLREKLSKINIFSDSTEHVERWLDQQEEEITQLEDETNSLFNKDRTLPGKLKEISELKNEIQSIRATFHQSASITHTVTSSQDTLRDSKRRDSVPVQQPPQKNLLALNLPLQKDSESGPDTKRKHILDRSRENVPHRSRSQIQHQLIPNFEAALYSSNNVSLAKPIGTQSDYPNKRLSVESCAKGLNTERTVSTSRQPNSSPVLKNIVNQLEGNTNLGRRSSRDKKMHLIQDNVEKEYFSLNRPSSKPKDSKRSITPNSLKKEFKSIKRDNNNKPERGPVVPKIHGLNQINNTNKMSVEQKRLSEAFAQERRSSYRLLKQPTETRNSLKEMSNNEQNFKSARESVNECNMDVENLKLKEGINMLAEQLVATANENNNRIQDYQEKLSQLEQENLELTERVQRSGSKKDSEPTKLRLSGAKRLKLLSTQDDGSQSGRLTNRGARAQSAEHKVVEPRKSSNSKEGLLVSKEREESTVKNIQTDLDIVKKKLTLVEGELLSTRKEKSMTYREYNAESSELYELKNQLIELTAKYNFQKEELNLERLRREQTESKCVDLETKTTILERENSDLYGKLQKRGDHNNHADIINTKLKEAKDENSKLQDDKSRFGREKLMLEEEINKRDMTIGELKKQIGKTQDSGKDLQKYVTKIKKLKEKKDKLVEENNILKYEMKKSHEKMKSAENEMHSVKEENYTLKREKDRFELELKILRPDMNKGYLNSYRGGGEDDLLSYRDKIDRRMSFEKRSYSPNRTSGRKTLQSRLEEKENRLYDNMPHLIKKTE